MKKENEGRKRRKLLTIRELTFEVVSWAPSHADVDLSIACIFEHEMPGANLAGGLRELDEALEGGVTKLRDEGYFRAQEMETLLVRVPLTRQVPASGILLIGLGNPLTLNASILERALRVAVREAVRFEASTVAFSPNLLDAGLTDVASLQVEAAMVRGVVGALNAEYRLSELGLSSIPLIRGWVFDVGAAHFDTAAEEFLRAFHSFAAPKSI